MRYRIRDGIQLVSDDRGSFLVRQRPLSVLRVNGSLAALVSRLLTNPDAPCSASEEQTLLQLAARGFVESDASPNANINALPSVSIVIPVKDREKELQRCLQSISEIDYPQELLQLIVVDDGSSDRTADVAREFGALLIPSGGRGRGPAAARNVGARAARNSILAFIDSDCTASTYWLTELAPSFCDTATAAVGGLVDGMCLDSRIDRYESAMSSLSLGKRERSANSGDDTFYLPSCNLLVRRSAFLEAGGFNDEMHVGEDVDLTWRLRDSGWTIRYLPNGRVFHNHRSTAWSFMSRRFDYGTSEGILQRLHPHRRKRMVVPPSLALLLMLCVSAPFTGGWSLAAAAPLVLVDIVMIQRKLVRQGVPLASFTVISGRMRALGSLIYYLSYHLVRYYTIPLIALSILSPWVGILLATALFSSARMDHSIKKPEISFSSFIWIYAMEQIAYGAGAFWGCLSRRTFSSYRVNLLRQVEIPT